MLLEAIVSCPGRLSRHRTWEERPQSIIVGAGRAWEGMCWDTEELEGAGAPIRWTNPEEIRLGRFCRS